MDLGNEILWVCGSDFNTHEIYEDELRRLGYDVQLYQHASSAIREVATIKRPLIITE